MRAGLDTDTIVAIATSPGRGGIGVIRLSGPEALSIAQRVCAKEQALEPRVAHFCKFLDQSGETLDNGLCLCFPGPGSFTGEDVAELQGHGSPVVLETLVQTCIRHGARLARPGEFSERSYLNGKMDLAQAEAVADLINAASDASARAAVRSLQGEFSELLNKLSADLVRLRVQVEAAIDFPDEDIEILSAPGVKDALTDLIDSVAQIVARTRTGVRLTEGARLVLVGAPNVGKSSVLNRLAGEDRAIVTSIAGTTRDLLREQLLLNGLPIELIDTAGLRETTDVIEAEGVRRAKDAARGADLVLAIHDLGDPDSLQFLLDWLSTEWSFDRDAQGAAALMIIGNKVDTTNDIHHQTTEIEHQFDKLALTNLSYSYVSAKTGQGISDLTDRLVGLLTGGDGAELLSSFSARSRHLEALHATLSGLTEAQSGIANELGAELVAEHLGYAQSQLGSVCGEITTDELLGEIFSNFCIGK